MSESARFFLIGMFITELFAFSFADSCRMNQLQKRIGKLESNSALTSTSPCSQSLANTQKTK